MSDRTLAEVQPHGGNSSYFQLFDCVHKLITNIVYFWRSAGSSQFFLPSAATNSIMTPMRMNETLQFFAVAGKTQTKSVNLTIQFAHIL